MPSTTDTARSAFDIGRRRRESDRALYIMLGAPTVFAAVAAVLVAIF